MVHIQKDLHGLTLDEARKKIREFINIRTWRIKGAIHNSQATRLTLVHGFNRGTIIRDYIRKGDMVSELIAMGIVKDIRLHNFSDRGTTTFDIIRPASSASSSANISHLIDVEELLRQVSEMNDGDNVE
jgi:hypothetical protein